MTTPQQFISAWAKSAVVRFQDGPPPQPILPQQNCWESQGGGSESRRRRSRQRGLWRRRNFRNHRGSSLQKSRYDHTQFLSPMRTVLVIAFRMIYRFLSLSAILRKRAILYDRTQPFPCQEIGKTNIQVFILYSTSINRNVNLCKQSWFSSFDWPFGWKWC